MKATASPFKRADKYFGLVIRARGACEHCGDTYVLQCAHGFSRSYRNTRWHEDNAFCLCRACHMYYTHHPLEWDDWLKAKWGDVLYGQMRALALSTEKPDVKELARYWENFYKELAA